MAFGAYQFSTRGRRRHGGQQKWSYINLCFFRLGLAVLLVSTKTIENEITK